MRSQCTGTHADTAAAQHYLAMAKRWLIQSLQLADTAPSRGDSVRGRRRFQAAAATVSVDRTDRRVRLFRMRIKCTHSRGRNAAYRRS